MLKQNYAIQLGKMLQPKPNTHQDVEIPHVKAQHVQWFHVRTTDAPKMWTSQSEITQFGVAQGDLLVCEGGEGGHCGILTQNADGYIAQNALHRIHPRERSRNDYLQYVMSSVAANGWFGALNDKATIAHFTREKFGALRVPIPPLSEQAPIVRFLDHADPGIRRYIRAKQKLIALLEVQKQANTPGRHWPSRRPHRPALPDLQALRRQVSAQMHPEPLGDELADHGCGPQSEGEFQLQRAFAEHGVVNPLEDTGLELGGTAASLERIKLVPAAAAVESEPPKDGTQVDAHGACHRLRALTSLRRGDGAFPEFRECLVIQSSGIGIHGVQA